MMVEGLSKMIMSTELSYDDFVETYGQIRSRSVSSGTQDSWKSDNHSTSTGSFSAIAEAKQTKCDNIEQGINTTTNKGKNHALNIVRKDMTQEETDPLPVQPVPMKRRNSRFSNAASRLARKSFRMAKKKTSAEDVNSNQVKPSSRPDTPVKWNKLFKWNQNLQKQPQDTKSSSVRPPIGDDNHVPKVTSQSTSFSRHNPATLTRSSSDNLIITSSTEPPPTTREKSSSLNLHKQAKTTTQNENHIKSNFRSVATEELQNSHPNITDIPEPKPCTPEYEIMKKYEDIREEEELRRVAIVTLLKRRKNSLKIKCDQFGKDLLDQTGDDDVSKTICSRIKQMKKKLKIVEQCIDEQTKAMKADSAKIMLQKSLELYQLDLIREERSGYSCCVRKKRQNKHLSKNNPSSSSASCETLQSVDENCVFDDTSSVNSLEQKDNNLNSSLSLCDRRSGSTGVCDVSTSKTQTEKCTSIDELRREGRNSGRCQSIDCAVTSDCDSGFGNGDTLSRSDISLDRSFSKSTGSIASSSSRGTLPLSASIQGSTSPHEQPRHYFFSSSSTSSEQHLHKTRDFKKCSTKQDKRIEQEVDASVLATIEDFERFAVRTNRRLSNKGKLVPLKKGC